jgi:hypothetical protein
MGEPISYKEIIMGTCSDFYFNAVEEYVKPIDTYEVFAAGFVTGQAEKVYLGAADAAMFAPDKEQFTILFRLARSAANRYEGLYIEVYGHEVWLFRNEQALLKFDRLKHIQKYSPTWHTIRAELCGIPEDEIDTEFHKRK